MDHSRIRSLPLLALKVKFFSGRPLDPLDFEFSAASWSPAAEARHTELTFETVSVTCSGVLSLPIHCQPPVRSL